MNTTENVATSITKPTAMDQIDLIESVFADLGMDEMCELCISHRARIAALVEACGPMRVCHTQFGGGRVGIALSAKQHADFLSALKAIGHG